MPENRNQVSNGVDRQQQPPRQGGNRGNVSLMNAGRQLQTDARNLATHAQEAGNEVQTFLTEQVKQRPYTVLAAAAGVGYVLGGGLSSKLTLMAFGMATRFAMAMAAREMGSWATEGFNAGSEH